MLEAGASKLVFDICLVVRDEIYEQAAILAQLAQLVGTLKRGGVTFDCAVRPQSANIREATFLEALA